MKHLVRRSGIAHTISQFNLHTLHFICKRNEPYLPFLASHSWYSFTDPGGMEGSVDLGNEVALARFKHATSRLQVRHSTTKPLVHLSTALHEIYNMAQGGSHKNPHS